MTNQQAGRLFTLCIDFDGVIHSYESGWEGQDIISDPPVPGAFKWLTELIENAEAQFVPCIYSSRSKYPSAVMAMKNWFTHHGLPRHVLERLQFPTEKPAARLTIDDRAICFRGTFPTQQEMIDFKPWNKVTVSTTPSAASSDPFMSFIEGNLLAIKGVVNSGDTKMASTMIDSLLLAVRP